MTEQSQWLEERRKGVGGSDVAAILGLSKWQTPLSVYNSKIGDELIDEDNASMEWGRRLEPVIRQKYCDTVGMTVTVPDQLIRSKEHPFMIANVDGIREDGRIVEIKTARSAADWGDEGTDQIPEYYLTQVQHYMTVTGADSCDVAVLIGASDFRIYTVKSDPELAAMLIEEESKFWQMVENKTPPAPRSLDEMKVAFPTSTDTAVEANAEINGALEELRNVLEEQKKIEGTAKELTAKIQGYMGTAERLTFAGDTLVTWKSTKPRVTFDSAALKKAMPDVYEQYTKLGAPSRRFMIK